MTVTEALKYVPPARHFVNGAFIESTGDARIDIRSPAFGDLIASVPDATPEDVNRAVARACEFEAPWPAKIHLKRNRLSGALPI